MSLIWIMKMIDKKSDQYFSLSPYINGDSEHGKIYITLTDMWENYLCVHSIAVDVHLQRKRLSKVDSHASSRLPPKGRAQPEQHRA